MGYRLGVDLGTTFTSAAVARGGTAEAISLGDHSYEVPSIVIKTAAGAFLFGPEAEAAAGEQPDRIAREFKRRIGDTTGVLLGGTPVSPHALTGKLLGWVVDQIATGQGTRPSEVVVTCPANWGPYRRELMDQVISISGLSEGRLCTEPEAAALYFASTGRLNEGDSIAVYDLGGGTFDAAVLRRERDGFSFLGTPEGIEQLGGLDFDDAVFGHVLRSLDLPEDADDPQSLRALLRLRRECVEAKEKLSHETAVTIYVGLAGTRDSVRMTRAELEELISPSIEQTVDCLERTVERAGLSAADLAAVVMVGGSARIPLVSEQVSRRLGRPVATSAHPKLCVAMGAALLPVRSEKPAVASVPRQEAPARGERVPPIQVVPPSKVTEAPATAADHQRPTPVAKGSRRPAGYALAAAGLLLVALLVALVGPTSTVAKALSWDVDAQRTATLPVGTAAGAELTPKILGIKLPGDPIKLDRATRTFEIANGYKLFLAGPVTSVVEPAGDRLLLMRSGGSWWSPLATIPGGVVILGILFAIAYAEALLRELRRQRHTVRAGQLIGMVGVGLVLGIVAIILTWMSGRLLTPASAVVVVISIAAAAGLLAFAIGSARSGAAPPEH